MQQWHCSACSCHCVSLTLIIKIPEIAPFTLLLPLASPSRLLYEIISTPESHVQFLCFFFASCNLGGGGDPYMRGVVSSPSVLFPLCRAPSPRPVVPRPPPPCSLRKTCLQDCHREGRWEGDTCTLWLILPGHVGGGKAQPGSLQELNPGSLSWATTELQ